MKNDLVIEPHYLGSLEYFTLLSNYSKVVIDVGKKFEKKTFLNRAHFLTANKVQQLNVPVSRSTNLPLKEAKIDYSHRWIKDHWGALYSGYGKAPFFEYFQEEIHDVWKKRLTFLVDLNLEMLALMIRMAQVPLEFEISENPSIEGRDDFRRQINPKKPFADRKIYQPIAYPQLFGDTFVSNLSIVDLIMNEGPNTAKILTDSYRKI